MTPVKRLLFRPLPVTFVALLVLSLTAGHVGALVTGLLRRDLLDGMGLSIPLPLLLAFHGMWAATGLVLGAAMLLRWPPTRRLMLGLVPLYPITRVGLTTVFATDSRLVSQLIVQTAGALIVLWLLTRPNVRDGFKPQEERTT